MHLVRHGNMPGDDTLNQSHRTWRHTSAGVLFALIGLLVGSISTVVAHETGDAVVEIRPSRISAGSTIQIVGDGFTPGTTLSMTLLTSERIPMGSVTADAEGHFTTDIPADRDLTPRPYEISVVAEDGVATSGFFTVLEPSADDSSWVSAPIVAGLAALCSTALGLLLLRRRRLLA